MTANNRGRSTTGEAAVPYYRTTPVKEAAKHLRLTVTRFLAEREPFESVHRAMEMLRAEHIASVGACTTKEQP